jgi:hypothetical protein
MKGDAMFTWRFMFFVLVMMSTSLPGLSRGGPPEEARQQDIEISAILKNPSVCIGTENLHVQVLVTNRREVPVDLDISRLSTTIGFVALVDITVMKFRHESFSLIYDPIGQAPPPQISALPPKGFFKKDLEIPIKGEFFNRAGFYKLNLSSSVHVSGPSQSSDVFSSDSAIFELRACESH